MTIATNTYYVERSASGLLELRQERFRLQRALGKNHPHDVCAVARTVEEMRGMVERNLNGGVDYSAVEREIEKS